MLRTCSQAFAGEYYRHNIIIIYKLPISYWILTPWARVPSDNTHAIVRIPTYLLPTLFSATLIALYRQCHVLVIIVKMRGDGVRHCISHKPVTVSLEIFIVSWSIEATKIKITKLKTYAHASMRYGVVPTKHEKQKFHYTKISGFTVSDMATVSRM